MQIKGKVVGYVRVSTVDQNPDRQLEGIHLDKKFMDYASGKKIDRPQLEAMLTYVREDDIVIVHSIDRLARSVKNLQQIIDQLMEKKVSLRFVKENLFFSSEKICPMSNLLLMMIGAISQFEGAIIHERLMEGIALAKKKGKYAGRKSKLTTEIKEKIIDELKTRKSKNDIAKGLGISRYTLYNYMKKIGEPCSQHISIPPTKK